ncbi:NAT16 [Branchiostoma lanceolatum]|uniref:NAT16 protein n=1 Tax=Branchiostoma lanceolatum TaxID=7740 RepID=A0A8J9ZYM4_BRALA|nr:NAT16 [Branchiostoma lanceolatum]
MAMTRGDPSFRLACHGDYDAVMRMSEGIYEGTDYLPAFFHSYIDDPDVTVFLAAVGDQVVGLRASKFTESGTVFIVKAARVAPDWRGQGVDRKMSLYQEEWVRRNRPNVKCKRSVMGTDSSTMIESMKKKMRHVFSLPYIGYQGGPSLWWRQDPAQLAQLDTTGLPDVVPLRAADGDFCTAVRKWLPSKAWNGYEGEPVILVDWDPYNFNPANIKQRKGKGERETDRQTDRQTETDGKQREMPVG